MTAQLHHPNHSVALTADDVLREVLALRAVVAAEARDMLERWSPMIRRAEIAPSLLNMAHFLALRRRDLRPLQNALIPWGLSSLGRSESRVLANIDAVIHALAALAASSAAAPAARGAAAATDLPPRPAPEAFFSGARLLQERAAGLFGPAPPHRPVRIMVTLPSEAATDAGLTRELVSRGMNVARLNCAHDAPQTWAAMIANVRAAAAALGRSCRVLMDLSGPRARTAEVCAPDPIRRVAVGDRLLLTRDVPQATADAAFAARCVPPAVLDQARIGDRILIDEGKIVARFESARADGLLAYVEHVPPRGGRLAPEKGLNLPDVTLNLDPLSDKDLRDLDFIVDHADLVGYSFVQRPAEVDRLHAELDRRTRHGDGPGVVLKIETARAVQELPELIVHSKGRRPLAIMIARGDLAVELGYERLAEMQEELLWLCEAAHVPVIWATQVLERLVKKGTPSRAEITDAAMGVRAECVMLNKGPCLARAVRILDDVLTRMAGHQVKKTPQLRALRVWTSVC